jgi:hypothetical protein
MSKDGRLMGLNLEIDEQYIAEVARTTIQAAVVAALGDKERLLTSVVGGMLAKKVDANGNVSSYSSDNKFSLLEAFVLKAVSDTTKEVVKEIVEENRVEFKKLLKKQLTTASNLDAFTKSFVDGTVNAIGDRYRSKIEITIDKSRD